MKDSTGATTTTSANSVQNVYTILLKKRINGYSFTSYNVVPFGSITSKITI